MVLMSVMVWIVGALPATADRTAQDSYTTILMLTPRIFLGSIIAYFQSFQERNERVISLIDSFSLS